MINVFVHLIITGEQRREDAIYSNVTANWVRVLLSFGLSDKLRQAPQARGPREGLMRIPNSFSKEEIVTSLIF